MIVCMFVYLYKNVQTHKHTLNHKKTNVQKQLQRIPQHFVFRVKKFTGQCLIIRKILFLNYAHFIPILQKCITPRVFHLHRQSII